MKILLISHSSGNYGAEKSLLSIAKQLSIRKHDVTVLVPSEGPLTRELYLLDIKFIVWPYFLWIGKRLFYIKYVLYFPLNVLSVYLFKYSHSKFKHYDIVYSNTIATNFGALLSSIGKKKHIWHVREYVHEDSNAKFLVNYKIAKYFFIKKSDAIIYNSKSVEDKFKNYFGSHESKVIYNGISFKSIAPEYSVRIYSKNKKFILLMVSSIKKEKGHYDALKALSLLIINYPNLILRIVGGISHNPYFDEMIKYIKNKGLSQNVEFLGYLDDPLVIMNESDIFLMCSEKEAFGRVTVEALFSGCPVIATNSGGTLEIIEDNINGILYTPGDWKQLSYLIEKLIINHQLRRSLSVNGKIRSYYFNLKNSIDAIEKVLISLSK